MWRTNQIFLLQEISVFLRLLLPLEASAITNEYKLPAEKITELTTSWWVKGSFEFILIISSAMQIATDIMMIHVEEVISWTLLQRNSS